MSTVSNNKAQVIQDTEEALARAARGERDPIRMTKALEEMARTREEIRKRVGNVDAVELIRDARNQ